MESTDIIANILHRAGIRYVVASSGSRCLRMVRSVTANGSFDIRMVVDERVAAFSAIGISDCTGQPVALVCTSGSAMLNYAPALAEAYHRGVPLAVITADRPADMIDINDGQTIHQFHALDNIVKTSIDIDATVGCKTEDFDRINETIAFALSPRKGPVHINLHLEEGNESLDCECEMYDTTPAAVTTLPVAKEVIALQGDELSRKKILIFIGQSEYDTDKTDIIKRLAILPNIVVVSDITGNCATSGVITDIESIIGLIKDNPQSYKPDLLITFGKTSPISRNFKEWLREINGYCHWRVNDRNQPEDTYSHLEKNIVVDDMSFLNYLSECVGAGSTTCNYNCEWHEIANRAATVKYRILQSIPWSDVSAINAIVSNLPKGYIVECSNGMSVRYLSLIGVGNHPVFANRGVNGIDGSTSTAIGFSSVSNAPTLLISGDMSALYDIPALYSGQLTPGFKMVIIANEGGEIFRMIKATRDYVKREEMLCKIPGVKWREVAASVGMSYFEASDLSQLTQILPEFYGEASGASLLVVHTAAGNSEIYRNLLNEIRIQS